MGNVKTAYRMIAGFLIFFMIVAGAVPAISACEGNCCSEEPVVHQDVCHESMLSFTYAMPDMGMPHKSISDRFFPIKDDPPDLPDCHKTNNHSCCEVDIPLAAAKTHDFGINSSWTIYYQSVAVLTSVSEFLSHSSLFHLKGNSYLSAARAAPVKLFLQNLSILC